jgi:hypothetical protein
MTKGVDLLPKEYLLHRRIRVRAVAWVGIAVVALLAMLVLGQVSSRRASLLEAQFVPIRAQAAQLRNDEERLPVLLATLRTDLESESLLLAKRADASVPGAEPQWASLLSDLVEAAPDNVSFSELTVRRERQQPGIGSKAGDQVGVSVSGDANTYSDVLGFVSRFSASPRVSRFELRSSSTPPGLATASRVSFQAAGQVK